MIRTDATLDHDKTRHETPVSSSFFLVLLLLSPHTGDGVHAFLRAAWLLALALPLPLPLGQRTVVASYVHACMWPHEQRPKKR